MFIRPYQTTDEESVIHLWQMCGLVVQQNNPHQDILRKQKVNPEWFLVGELDGVLIASCMAGYEGHRGWINYLAVHPEHQGRGFASQILAEAESSLRAAGCPKINLQVRASNSAVIAFYQHLGFTVDGVVGMGKRLEDDSK